MHGKMTLNWAVRMSVGRMVSGCVSVKGVWS